MSISKVASGFKRKLSLASEKMTKELYLALGYAASLSASSKSENARKLANKTYQLWVRVKNAKTPITSIQVKMGLKEIAALSAQTASMIKNANDLNKLHIFNHTIRKIQPMDAGLYITADQERANRYLQQLDKPSLGDLTDEELSTYYSIRDPNTPHFTPISRSVAETPQQTPPKQTTQSPTHPGPAKGFGSRKALLNDGDPINPEIQKALIKFFPGSEKWIKVDGIVGPNTRGALNRYKAQYKDDRDVTDPSFQEDLIRASRFVVPMNATQFTGPSRQT